MASRFQKLKRGHRRTLAGPRWNRSRERGCRGDGRPLKHRKVETEAIANPILIVGNFAAAICALTVTRRPAMGLKVSSPMA